MYLDRVQQLMTSSAAATKEVDHSAVDDLARSRLKLCAHLESSTLYRVQLMLSKIENLDLSKEKAILFGKVCTKNANWICTRFFIFCIFILARGAQESSGFTGREAWRFWGCGTLLRFECNINREFKTAERNLWNITCYLPQPKWKVWNISHLFVGLLYTRILFFNCDFHLFPVRRIHIQMQQKATVWVFSRVLVEIAMSFWCR